MKPRLTAEAYALRFKHTTEQLRKAVAARKAAERAAKRQEGKRA